MTANTSSAVMQQRSEPHDSLRILVACETSGIGRRAFAALGHDVWSCDRMPADLPAPQMVQPFWFGEPAYKGTGWYLRGLPQLVATDVLPEPEPGGDEWKAWNAVHRMSPGPNRARLRSRSFAGMMNAAADQWGGFAMKERAA